MSFNDRLKDLRQAKGLTQQELAKKIFVSRSTVAKWENGLGIPSSSNLKALCDYLEIDEAWLLDRSDLKRCIETCGPRIKNAVASVIGIMLPILFLLFSLSKIFYFGTPFEMRPLMLYPVFCIFDFVSYIGIGLAGIIWGATFVFSILNVCVVRLRAKSTLCFWINFSLIILSAVVFIAIFIISVLNAKQLDYWLAWWWQ